MRSMDYVSNGRSKLTKTRAAIVGVLMMGFLSLIASAPTPVCAQSLDAALSEPMAKGLIVKLKDSKPQSVVRLRASSRPSDSAQSQRQRLYAATMRKRVGFVAHKPTAFGAHVIHAGHLTTLSEAEAEAERLRKDPDVEWVVVNQLEKSAAQPVITVTPGGSSWFSGHFWLEAKTSAQRGVAGFADAWATMSNTSGNYNRLVTPIVTAVLDTGILPHPDTTGSFLSSPAAPDLSVSRVARGYDFVSEADYSNDGNGLDPDPSDPGDAHRGNLCENENSTWHGTMVASMLSAPHDSGIFGPGILAPLPGQVVLPVRIGGACGALLSDIIEGMLWAAGIEYQGSPGGNPAPARVINLSFGGGGTCVSSGSDDVLYRNTIATLLDRGVLVVSSAGNGTNQLGTSGAIAPTRPANCPGVMAVTALRKNGSKAKYANLVNGTPAVAGYYGISVAGGDTGEGLDLLINDGTDGPVVSFSKDMGAAGTSFAAPQVAGVAAMIMSINPALSAVAVRQLIMDEAAPHESVGGIPSCSVINTGNCQCDASTCGVGILDANAAVQRAIATLPSVPGNAFPSAVGSSSSFVPTRVSRASKGGGGSSDDGFLVMLAAVLGFMVYRQSCRTVP